MPWSIASVARSLLVVYKLTGNGVRYSRRKNFYPPKRYADQYYSYHYVTKAVDQLADLGLAKAFTGYWYNSANRGWQSTATATSALVNLTGDVVERREGRGEPERFEAIVLRKSKDDLDGEDISDLKDYSDTDEVAKMRVQVEVINTSLGTLDVWVGSGQTFGTVRGRRIFNGTFDRGGRFYLQGDSVQNMPRRHRAWVRLQLDGELRDTVELDYKSLHPVMAYTQMGLPIPVGDLYEIEGYDRDVVKRAFLIMLNARDLPSAMKALTHHLRTYAEHRTLCGIESSSGKLPRIVAEYIVEAIAEKHEPIKELFGSDCGARFMRTDSDMAIQVMLQMIEKTGRCPLPVHDSFIVVTEDQEDLQATMLKVAGNRGLDLQVDRKS
ncbi:hypothetical protein GCM10010409_31170 [Mycolicibacterium diernhoferi]